MLQLARIRGSLLLSLKDVERWTGVPAAKLSKVERGQGELNDAQQHALQNFYEARWRVLEGLEDKPV